MFRMPIDEELELRIFEERHTMELFELTDANRAHLRPWLIWADRTNSPSDSASFIRGGLYQFSDGNGFQAGIWYRGQLSGAVGLHYLDRTNRRTEIGYWLGAAYEGKGIMTRTVRGLVDFVFGELGFNRVEIRCARTNNRSRAVAERLGFKLDGTLREAEWLLDHFEDQLVFSMLAHEWRA